MSRGNTEPLIIKKYPDKVLRKRCTRVRRVSEKEKRLFEEMFFTMKHFCGIGLAAPQIGISQKLIVAGLEERTIKLANPEIIKVKGADAMTEGCLSLPGSMVEVKRPYEVIVTGLNEKGDVVEIKAKGLLARVLQHETDHLNSKLIIDYMNPLEKVKFKLSNRRG